MNDQNSTELIDENELRAALRPLRPDADAFAAAVQQKLESSILTPSPSKDVTARSPDWASVAASVIPIPLFGKTGANAAGSLAKVSLSKKLIAIVALPAISLVLMLGGTLWCMFKISRASKDTDRSAFDSTASWEAVSQWWQRFGWSLVAIPFLHFGLTMLNIVIPLVLVFAVSGLAMVWLITKLGRRGLIDRQHLIGGLTAGFIVLTGFANIGTIVGGSAVHLLDQGYITAVLFGGLFLLVAINVGSAAGAVLGDRKTQLLIFGAMMIPLGFLFGFMFQSLWRPVTIESVQHYVADFKEAPFSTASWRHWVVPAHWLKEKGIDTDMSGAQRLALQEATDGQNLTILNHALDFELISPNQAPIVERYEYHRNRLFKESYLGKEIQHLDPTEYVVRKLLLEGQVTERQRDLLSDRLAETLRVELKSEYVTLEKVQAITNFMKLIDRPAGVEEFGGPVQELLLKMQRLNNGAFQSSGGFASYPSVDHCDDNATSVAIELMDDWGVPDGIDVMALRSYLRPTFQDRSMTGTGDRKLPGIRDGGAHHFVGRQRLNDMLDVPAVTVWDYLRYEQNLIMSVLLIVLSIFAVLVAPNRIAPVSR